MEKKYNFHDGESETMWRNLILRGAHMEMDDT